MPRVTCLTCQVAWGVAVAGCVRAQSALRAWHIAASGAHGAAEGHQVRIYVREFYGPSNVQQVPSHATVRKENSVRRYRVRLLIGVTLLLALSGIILEEQGMWSASAQPANTSCTGALTGTFANVVVPASASCTLTNALVQGNVQVQSNARLVVGGASTIRGNVAANQCVSVMLSGTVTVSGNVAIQRCTQPSGYTGPGIQISGNVACQDNAGACVAQSGTVSGNMQIQNNRSAAATDISRNSIRGNLQCQGNTPAPTHVLGPNVVTGNATGQCSASLGFVTTTAPPWPMPAPIRPSRWALRCTSMAVSPMRSVARRCACAGPSRRPRRAAWRRCQTRTAVKPTFVADLPGTYTVQLLVNDGTGTVRPIR